VHGSPVSVKERAARGEDFVRISRRSEKKKLCFGDHALPTGGLDGAIMRELSLAKRKASINEGLNRRATVRYRCTPPALSRAFLANSSKSVDAVIVNLSEGGAGLLLGSYVEPGTLVRIEIGNSGETPCADLAAHINNVVKLDDATWRCGCEWVRTLTVEELQVLQETRP
jgi:hypothetical protein